jgi:starvation-inducible DNA-binding protein
VYVKEVEMSKSPITSPLGDAEREATGATLQATLVDLVDLSLVAKQAHWNVVGSNFRSAHLQLDELVSAARQYVDDVAERANAIGISPNGKAKTVVESSGVPDYPENWQSVESTVAAIVDILGEVIKRLRKRIDETDKTDLVTQDLFIEIAAELEKQHWMWQAQTA